MMRVYLGAAHGQVANVKGLDHLALFVIPQKHFAVVERAEHPVFRRVHVYAFHAVRPRLQLFLNLEAERLCAHARTHEGERASGGSIGVRERGPMGKGRARESGPGVASAVTGRPAAKARPRRNNNENNKKIGGANEERKK